MAYWDPEDNFSDLNYDNEYKSNITVPGPELYNRLPSMPASKNLVAAHFKSLRFYRRICRYMPFIVYVHGLQHFANPHQGKLMMAKFFRINNKVRNPQQIDQMVIHGTDNLCRILAMDSYDEKILCQLAPMLKNNVTPDCGINFFEDSKYKGKSPFLKDFYLMKDDYPIID